MIQKIAPQYSCNISCDIQGENNLDLRQSGSSQHTQSARPVGDTREVRVTRKGTRGLLSRGEVVRKINDTVMTPVESIQEDDSGMPEIVLFDVEKVAFKLKAAGTSNERADLRGILKNMLNMEGKVTPRTLPKNHMDILDTMEACYPHFSEVTKYLRKRMMIAAMKNRPLLSLGVNILLDGPPGVGKTSYLMMVSKMLGTEFTSYSCSAHSNGFDLVGLSGGYGSGKYGKLHEILVEQSCPNPIVLLDEVEKTISEGGNSNFSGTLFGLLEKNNAKTFKDEFIDVEMDASYVNWFATSNDASLLDAAIKDRFVVLKVNAPNEDDLKKMIPNIYEGIIRMYELKGIMEILFV